MIEKLILNLFDINVIKFGEYTLKSGIISPIYIDAREMISYPQIMKDICESVFARMTKDVDLICGVPYITPVPIASYISIRHNIPMVMRRKEIKKYGTQRLIEGLYEKGMTCCLIEDVITTGSSVIETVKDLESIGLKVTEVIILIDRDQGGLDNLIDLGINVKTLLSLNEILSILLSSNKISHHQYQMSKEFLKINQNNTAVPKVRTKIDWQERSNKSNNKMAKKIFEIINTKKTNLCVSADVKTMSELITLTREVAPLISILKLHANSIHDFNLDSMKIIRDLSIKENFLIMEDRKFADIGNTIKSDLESKCMDYLSWCDLITVHALPGDDVLSGVRSAAKERNVDIGCFIVAEMSSKGALANPEYKANCAAMAERHNDIVAGFISQSLVNGEVSGFLIATPGVKFAKGDDALGQVYRSVEDLKKAGFVDIFIVGRGITQAENPGTEAALYRKATFDY